jgi:hypothetical protein
MAEVEVGLRPIKVEAKDVIEKAELDLNVLAMLCLFDTMQFKYPDMFIAMWQLMKSKVHLVRDFSKIALGIPRGFAKTTFVKIWIIYCVLFTSKQFVLVVSYNEDHAISIINDVCKMLSGPNIRQLFGNWDTNKEKDQAALKIFKFRGKTMILKAVGAKGGIRGANEEHRRPDVIILEDYQKKEDSDNEEVSKKLYQELMGTVLKAKSPFGCIYIFVANMYPTPGSILKKLKENSDWTSLVVGGIKADGTSLWEDLHPIKQLIEEYEGDLKAGVPEVFLAEVLNDETAGIKSGIDITKLPQFPYPDDELPQGRAVVIDPALDNPNSDYNGVGLVGLYDGLGTLEKAILGKFNPLELIKNALILAHQSGCKLICVEAIAYQASLLFWFNKICEDNGIEGFIFMPLKVGSASKNAKILAALRKWQGGDKNKETGKTEPPSLFVKKEVRPLIINEIIKFNPTKKNNQDTCLDLLTFCDKVVEQYRDLMFMEYEPEVQAFNLAAPRELEDNCVF